LDADPRRVKKLKIHDHRTTAAGEAPVTKQPASVPQEGAGGSSA
jgi:hypothetical protein